MAHLTDGCGGNNLLARPIAPKVMRQEVTDRQSSLVSEDDLREHFDQYRELVEELSRRYPLPPDVESVPVDSSGTFVLEPILLYQVHARSYP
jgi:hypothetical protein